MKKILLTLAVASCATFASAQRTIDWSVEQIILPTELNSTVQSGTTITYEIVMKNNGTDTVYTRDSIGYQFSGLIGSNVVFAIPNGSVFLRPARRTIDPGDTIHFVGSLTFNTYPTTSQNITFRAFSVLYNRAADGITPETTATNNSKTTPMVWWNPYRWGVSVNNVFTNNMQVYPNPASSDVFVNLNVVEVNAAVSLTLTDMNGRVVYSENVQDVNNIHINTANLNKGIYLLNIVNGDQVSSSKISIQ